MSRSALRAIWIVTAAMLAATAFADSLDQLPKHKRFSVGRESSFNPQGNNYDWRPIAPGESLTVADIKGPGCVTHIWFTYMYPARGGLRKLVLRAWFDGARTPCVEAPLGDFFGLGNAISYSYASEPLAVGTHDGLNSFWRMPFARRARFTVTNEGKQPCKALYYYIDYQRYDKPQPDTACFHAQYRQAMPCEPGKPYTILEAKGHGHFVGCNLSVEQNEEGWWGEGDDKFYIDGGTTPTLWGTGSEDYFSGAWCFGTEYAFSWLGMPFRGRENSNVGFDRCTPWLPEDKQTEWRWPVAWRKGDLWNVYRYHIQDPVPFRKSLRMEIEHGHVNNEQKNSYSSVAYWYQDEPHAQQPALAPALERMPHFLRLHERAPGFFEAEDFVDEAITTSSRVTDVGMGFWGKLCSRQSILEWKPEKTSEALTLRVPVSRAGEYELELAMLHSTSGVRCDCILDGRQPAHTMDTYDSSRFPSIAKESLGKMELADGIHELTFIYAGSDKKAESRQLGIDTIFLKPVKQSPKDEPTTGSIQNR